MSALFSLPKQHARQHARISLGFASRGCELRCYLYCTLAYIGGRRSCFWDPCWSPLLASSLTHLGLILRACTLQLGRVLANLDKKAGHQKCRNTHLRYSEPLASSSRLCPSCNCVSSPSHPVCSINHRVGQRKRYDVGGGEGQDRKMLSRQRSLTTQLPKSSHRRTFL